LSFSTYAENEYHGEKNDCQESLSLAIVTMIAILSAHCEAGDFLCTDRST